MILKKNRKKKNLKPESATFLDEFLIPAGEGFFDIIKKKERFDPEIIREVVPYIHKMSTDLKSTFIKKPVRLELNLLSTILMELI